MKAKSLCALLLAAVSVAGADEAAPVPSETGATAPSTKAAEEGSAPEDTTSSTPYEPFVPSESISGDSSVTFPVDI